MVKVILKGILGKQFGEEWKLSVKTPREALRAISANKKNFRTYLCQNKNLFLKFKIDGKDIENRSLLNKKEFKTFEIIPVFIGGMNKETFGIIQIVVGGILIGAGIALTVFGYGFIGIPLIMAGIAIQASGVITLLTPTPSYDRQGNSRNSSLFDGGGVSTAVQGVPVPVIYGELIVDGLPIVSAITTTDDDEQ